MDRRNRFPQCREFAVRSATELGVLTSQRYPTLKAISNKTRAVRATGALAARQVDAQLTALVKAEGLAPNREFERMSLQLNRVPASAAQREASSLRSSRLAWAGRPGGSPMGGVPCWLAA